MRKVIQFEVAADFALYQRPDSRSQTYAMPTPGALRGMIKAVSHDNKVWVVPLKVELLTEPKTILISQHMLLGAQIKKGHRPRQIKRKIESCLYLQDVEYRVTVEVTGPPDQVARMERRLAEGSFCTPPYLGRRECLAETRPVTDKPVVDVTFTEPYLWLGNRGPVVTIVCNHGVIEYPYELTRQAINNRYHECRARKAARC